MNIDKDSLEKCYIRQRLSSHSIAQIYQCSSRTILDYLERFNIPKRTYKDNIMPTPHGCKLSREHRLRISKAMMGERNPMYGKENPRRLGKIVHCIVCNKELYRKKCQFNPNNMYFCCSKCQSLYKKGRKLNEGRFN